MRLLPLAIQLAGLGQLGLAAGSLAIPRVLGWRLELRRLEPLTRHVFWTYAGYIFCTNVAMGLVSLLAPARLLDGTPLALAVLGYISLYWGARLVIQFVWFGKASPPGRIYRLAEAALVALIVFLVGAYATALVLTLRAPS